MKRVYILSVACLIFAMLSEATFAQDRIIGVEQLTSQAVQYERMDFGVEVDASYLSPYDSEEISLDFKAITPSGKEIVVPVFYSLDEEGWRTRFTPRETGILQYRIVLMTGGAVVDESEGDSFEVAENTEAKGFL
jgi:hypothetical protein